MEIITRAANLQLGGAGDGELESGDHDDDDDDELGGDLAIWVPYPLRVLHGPLLLPGEDVFVCPCSRRRSFGPFQLPDVILLFFCLPSGKD